MLAKNDRNNLDLLGQPANSFRAATAAVTSVDKGTGEIQIAGGRAMNLYPGCELKRIVPEIPAVGIKVVQVTGLSSSTAAIIENGPGAAVKVGDLFQLDRWVVPAGESLRIYMGTPVPMDPGTHRLHGQAQGFIDRDQVFTAAERSVQRIELTLLPGGNTAPPPPPPPPPSKLPPALLLASGGVALVAGVTMLAMSFVKDGQVNTLCGGSARKGCPEADAPEITSCRSGSTARPKLANAWLFISSAKRSQNDNGFST